MILPDCENQQYGLHALHQHSRFLKKKQYTLSHKSVLFSFGCEGFPLWFHVLALKIVCDMPNEDSVMLNWFKELNRNEIVESVNAFTVRNKQPGSM